MDGPFLGVIIPFKNRPDVWGETNELKTVWDVVCSSVTIKA